MFTRCPQTHDQLYKVYAKLFSVELAGVRLCKKVFNAAAQIRPVLLNNYYRI